MVKLSIIIPVYNVEKYIGNCLLSCIEQNISQEEYEIIVINDGTPDASMTIADELSHRFKNICIHNQENQGLSVARNNGLKVATGTYVWFVDSDDSIEKNCLKGIVEALSNNIDILQIQYQNVYEDGTPPKVVEKMKYNGIIKGRKALMMGNLPTPAQFCIYKRDFLIKHELWFYPGIFHEDVEFKPRAYYYAERVMSYDKIVYNYLQRHSGSITSSYRLKNGLDFIKVCASLYNFSNDLDDAMKSVFAERITQIINTNMYRLYSLNKKERSVLLNEWKNKRNLFQYMLKSKSITSKIEGCIFLLNVNMGASLFRIPYLLYSAK